MIESGLLTVAETANLLRLKPSTVRAWVLRRRLPYYKVGRLVRFGRADVDALIAASVVLARPENAKETKQQRKVSSNANQNPQLLPKL